MVNLCWLDIVILAAIALSMLTGLFRGFVKEIMSLCVWGISLGLAFHFSSTVEPWLKEYISDVLIRQIAAFVSILISSLIIGGLFNALLSFILKHSGLSGTDRLLGVGFGFARGVFIVSLMLLMIKITISTPEHYTKDSKLYTKFDPLVNWMYALAPNFIQKIKSYDKLNDIIDIKTDEIEQG